MWKIPFLAKIPLVLWLLAIGLRFWAIGQPAHGHDINLFLSWGSHLLSVGPHNFFATVWTDYLPLPLLSLAPIVSLSRDINLPFALVFKTILSLLELLLIAKIIRPLPYRAKNLSLAFLALSPALIGDTAYWGQIDSIPALLVLYSTVTLLNSHSPSRYPFLASLALGLAVAIKPIMLIVAPVLWIFSLRRYYWWSLPVFSFLVFLSTALPFTPSPISAILLLFDRALTQASTYPYTTINAWNIWSITAPSIWPPDDVLVLGLSAHAAGLILFGAFTSISLWQWSKHKFAPAHLFRILGTILATFFIFSTRMHERHLLFALPFLALAASWQRFLIVPTLALTLTFSLNLFSAYYWYNHNQVWPFSPSFTSLVSWINTLIILALNLVWDWRSTLKSTLFKLKSNKILVIILLLASLLRLVNLSYPTDYVFDEVYHAFTAREYLHNKIVAWEWWTTPPEGVAYEWTHPPVAKYGMVLGMLLFGENSFGWRVGSAIAGVVSIYGLYLLILRLTSNHSLALLSAFLVSIEGLHIAQSRVAMNDAYMLCFLIWSLYAAVKMRWKSAAVLYGLALASKWSALYGVIPLGFIYLHQNNFPHWNLKSILYHLLTTIRYLLISVFVYVLTFTPFILAGHSWDQWIELHRQMWYYHTHLVATHAYQSTPQEWIFSARPVWYHVKYLSDHVAHIYAQSNPIILWFGLVALLLQLPKITSFPSVISYTLYAVFTLPWIFSPRIMFFYHYLPSATFLSVILASWLLTLPPRFRYSLIILCIIGLIIVFPTLFGVPMSNNFWTQFFTVFPNWK